MPALPAENGSVSFSVEIHRHMLEVIWRTWCEPLWKRATSLIDEAYPITSPDDFIVG